MWPAVAWIHLRMCGLKDERRTFAKSKELGPRFTSARVGLQATVGWDWRLSRSFKLPKVGRHPCRILMISYLVLVNAQRQSRVQLCHKLLKY